MSQLIKAIKTELALQGEVTIDTDEHSAACLEDSLNNFSIGC
jgi:hypothetical protein